MSNYTINGNRVFKTFNRLCDRMHWKPSRWLPTIKTPEYFYTLFHTYSREGKTGESYRPFFDGYHLLFLLAEGWGLKRTAKVFGQLFEIYTGIYDWHDPDSWVRATPKEREELKNLDVQMPASWKDEE